MRSTNYRLLDQISLALERGNDGVLDVVRGKSIIGLGPIVEVLSLRSTQPALGRLLSVCTTSVIVGALPKAQENPLRLISGNSGHGHWGLLHFRKATNGELVDPLHVFQIEMQKALSFSRRVTRAKARICGAVKEMVDNIFEHSGAPDTGVAAFMGSADGFEISIGDAGMGVLASLRSNPMFSYLHDAGTAMAHALKDGNSRYPSDANRGYGFGTLLRSLNSLDAELRFRSGNYALEITGRSPLQRNPHISQKADLRGFVVSVRLAL